MRLTQNSQFLAGRYKMYFTDRFFEIGDVVAFRDLTSDIRYFEFEIIDGPVEVGIDYQYLLKSMGFDTAPHIGGTVYAHTPSFETGDRFFGINYNKDVPWRRKYQFELEMQELQHKQELEIAKIRAKQLEPVAYDPMLAKFAFEGSTLLNEIRLKTTNEQLQRDLQNQIKEKEPVLVTQYDLADLVPNNSEMNDIGPPKSILSRIKRLLK